MQISRDSFIDCLFIQYHKYSCDVFEDFQAYVLKNFFTTFCIVGIGKPNLKYYNPESQWFFKHCKENLKICINNPGRVNKS